MAISSDKNTSEVEKSTKEPLKYKDRKERPLTKIVVRRLPPGIDLESFLNQVSPIPEYDYIYLVKADLSLGENAFSRVYINFVNASDIFNFKEKFDNYVFVDQKGHEYPAVVEFAAFQKIPRKRKPRPDPKSGSLESDPYYLEFIESLKEQPNQDEKPEFSYSFNDNKNEVVSTPLLDYIKQKRVDKQRIREERREERKKRELDRKKFRDEERKRLEHKSANKSTYKGTPNSRATKIELPDSIKEEGESVDPKPSPEALKEVKKEIKHEEKSYAKPKPKYSERPEFSERKNDYKGRRDDYKEKEYRNRRFDDFKRDFDSSGPRRAKKYSEKREERKIEAKKAEQKRLEGQETSVIKPKADSKEDSVSKEKLDSLPKEKLDSLPKEKPDVVAKDKVVEDKTEPSIPAEGKLEASKSSSSETIASTEKDDENRTYKCKESDTRSQRRIKNKDRPTMAIYQPGMLSKRKSVEGSEMDNDKD